MSRIIFFRCRISEARKATVRQGLTEKNLTPWGQHYFVAQREAKKCGTNFVPENSYTTATAVRQ